MSKYQRSQTGFAFPKKGKIVFPGEERQEDDSSLTDSLMDEVPGGESTLEDTFLKSFKASKEFPPLSSMPIPPGKGISFVSPADTFVLNKQTPLPPDQGDFRVTKNLDSFIPESEKMISSGHQQAKHANAMTAELALLLSNEKKILDQLMKRCAKFSHLKEINKIKHEDWLIENQKRYSRYEKNLTKLSNYPEDPLVVLGPDRMQSQVKQRVLLELIHKTAEVASNISVQLSIEDTIINDVDTSLSDMKKHSAVMVRLIDGWLKNLSCHDHHQQQMVQHWMEIKQSLKEAKTRAKVEVKNSDDFLQSVMKRYDDRLKEIEKKICRIRCEKNIPNRLPIECDDPPTNLPCG